MVSIGCGANRRTAGFCSAADAGSFARDDFVDVSIGCGANRLTFGASSFSGECLRVLDDLVVVSKGTGANRLAGADALLMSASAGVFCSGEDIARWRAVAQAFVKCYPGAHTLLVKVKGADQANSEISRAITSGRYVYKSASSSGVRHESSSAGTGTSKKSVVRCGRDRKSTRLNSSHSGESRMPSSA